MFVYSIVPKKRDKDILVMDQELKIMGLGFGSGLEKLDKKASSTRLFLMFCQKKFNLGYTQTQPKPSLKLNFRSVQKTG